MYWSEFSQKDVPLIGDKNMAAIIYEGGNFRSLVKSHCEVGDEVCVFLTLNGSLKSEMHHFTDFLSPIHSFIHS